MHNRLKLHKKADLYHNKLFTVVPLNVDVKLGVFPDDQGFSKKAIILWDSAKDLLRFPEDKYKTLEVKIPDDIKRHTLRKLVGSAYTLPYLSNQWEIREISALPKYVQ